VDWSGLHPLADAVAAASPTIAFVTVDHLRSFTR